MKWVLMMRSPTSRPRRSPRAHAWCHDRRDRLLLRNHQPEIPISIHASRSASGTRLVLQLGGHGRTAPHERRTSLTSSVCSREASVRWSRHAWSHLGRGTDQLCSMPAAHPPPRFGCLSPPHPTADYCAPPPYRPEPTIRGRRNNRGAMHAGGVTLVPTARTPDSVPELRGVRTFHDCPGRSAPTPSHLGALA